MNVTDALESDEISNSETIAELIDDCIVLNVVIDDMFGNDNFNETRHKLEGMVNENYRRIGFLIVNNLKSRLNKKLF
jgi:hypothetical protein